MTVLVQVAKYVHLPLHMSSQVSKNSSQINLISQRIIIKGWGWLTFG